MEVFIVTGASRGLGAALADHLLSNDRRVICIARTANPALEALARERKAWLDYYLQDLSDVEGSDALATSVCGELPADATRYVLINNAALVTPISTVGDLPGEDVVAALHTNVASAMLFAARFLKATEDYSATKQILNISSGLGRHPMAGSSVYCTSKAALDMFTRCVNVEQAQRAHPCKAVSLAPGVIDTDMQSTIRTADPASLPAVERFRDLKASSQLASPADAATKIVAYLDSPDFGQRELDDIRNS